MSKILFFNIIEIFMDNFSEKNVSKWHVMTLQYISLPTLVTYVISGAVSSSKLSDKWYESFDKVTDESPESEISRLCRVTRTNDRLVRSVNSLPELLIGIVILDVMLFAPELFELILFHLSMIPSISRPFSLFLSALDKVWFSLVTFWEWFELLDPVVEVLVVSISVSSALKGIYHEKFRRNIY